MVKKRNKSNPLPWIIIAVMAVVGGIVFVANNISNGDICGERGMDEERKGYCATSSEDYGHLVIVAGNTQNSPAPNLDFTSGDLRDLLAGVFYSASEGGYPDIKIISAAKGSDIIEFKNVKPAKNNSASNNNLTKLGRAINSAIKSSPKRKGADYFNAILEANKYLNNNKDDSKKLIVVIGSGYSDSGILDFAHGDILNRYINNNSFLSTALANDIRIKEGMLSGVSLKWYNMGDVVAPQDSMDDYKLTTGNIYTEALAYAGADGLELNLKNNPSAQAVETDYTVDRVYAEKLKLGDDVMVDDTITKFINNQTSLQNPDVVKKYLNSFVSKYKMSGSKSLLVTGYMDHCLPNKKDLSLGRAETIKSILVEMGIPADNIKTTGEIGPPPTNFDEPYKCVDDTNMPDEEQRTVRIAVVG